MDIYVVQQGDTIFSIAERYGVTATKLSQDNGLDKPFDLVTGQNHGNCISQTDIHCTKG